MSESNVILSTIERKGWQTAREHTGWRVCRADSEAVIHLSFTPSWVCLRTPCGAADDGWSDTQLAHLYRYLLRRNEAMFMAKFGLDDQGTPVLLVEVPRRGSPHLVERAFEASTRYLAMYAGEIARAPGGDLLPESGEPDSAPVCDEPPGIPHELIAYYLRAVEPWGWGARSKPKGITWHLGYKGQRMFDVFFTVTKSWAYFHVPALPEDSAVLADVGVRKTFFQYLLQVNQTWYMAKIGLNDQDGVLLMLEVPTQELDFDMFRSITRTLATYLDFYTREIQIMSHLPSEQRLMELLAEC